MHNVVRRGDEMEREGCRLGGAALSGINDVQIIGDPEAKLVCGR